MNKKPEYSISPSSSRVEILEVLTKLEADAADLAREHAYQAFFTKDEEQSRLAAEYEGKREILHSLVWAFGGTAETDGCEPKVDIY